MEQLTLQDAAARLGVSVDTLRRRLKRGELAGHKDADGRWWVTVGEEAGTVAHVGAPGDPRDQLIEVLREQLEARTREVQELHLLLAQRPQLGPGTEEAPAPRPGLWARMFGPRK